MALRESQSSSNLTISSLTIAKHLFSTKEYTENNVVFSPLSLQVVLSIIAAGAEGPTQQELLDFLRFESTNQINSYVSHLLSVLLKDVAPTPPAPAPAPPAPAIYVPPFRQKFMNSYFMNKDEVTPTSLSLTNGVWVEQTLPLQPSFKQIVSSDYQATLSSGDFINNAIEVMKEVNLWAEKKTNGLIKEILPRGSVDNLTRLIFANALYFKGAWGIPFPDWRTKNYEFHLLNGSSIKVPFMSSNLDQFIGVFDYFKVLRLPYDVQGEDKRQFSMYIFLPNAKDGLPLLIDNLTSAFQLLENNLPLKDTRIGDFRIPRFKFSFGLETSDMLKELGMILPFSSGGFTKMVDSLEGQNLFVSNIFHKSFIEVNEKGTVAAAATSAPIAKCIPRGIDFVADHPFLFLIKEDSTGTILFVGQVLNPVAE